MFKETEVKLLDVQLVQGKQDTQRDGVHGDIKNVNISLASQKNTFISLRNSTAIPLL